MTEYAFGLHNGHLTTAADEIARHHRAWHVNYTDPNRKKHGWFACKYRGFPFDERIVELVLNEIEEAGGLDALRASE